MAEERPEVKQQIIERGMEIASCPLKILSNGALCDIGRDGLIEPKAGGSQRVDSQPETQEDQAQHEKEFSSIR
jgi:hypothetical protein